MNRFFFLGVGVMAFIASFFIAKFFIQFIVLAVFCMVMYILGESRYEIANLKKTIYEHNDLLKEALDEEKEHSRRN